MVASLLAVVYRILLANILTAFYSTVVHMTYSLQDMKNPPNTTVPAALTLPSQCIDPKYGEHIYPKVNNIHLHCVASGNTSNQLMLLVHGFPEVWYSWRNQIVEFNTKFRVVACDMRGFGDSDRPLSVAAYNIKYLASDIKGLIEALGYTKAILLSHDWGGVISNRVRETYPSYVTAHICISSTSLEAWWDQIWNNPDQRKASGYYCLYRSCNVPEMRLRRDNYTIFDKFLLTADNTTVTKADTDCYKYWFSQPGAATSAVNLYRANVLFNYSLSTYSDNIPSVLLQGSSEVALDKKIAPVMQSIYLSGFKTMVVQGVGHFMPQQNPTVVNPIITEFLTNNSLI